MKLRMVWIGCIALAGCDAVVVPADSESGSSTSSNEPTTGDPSGPVTTTIPPTTDPSSTTVAPPGTSSTTDDGTSSGEYGTTWASSGTTPEGSSDASSGEGSGSTGGSTGSTSNTGISFIDPTDTGPNVECDPYLQDCPDGEKCNPWANDGGSNWNALGCFPVDPTPNQPGEACLVEDSGVSGVDTCDVGSMCWDVDAETDQGVCVAMCEGSADMPTCSPPGTSCVISNQDVLNLCLPACDPLLQDCEVDQGCYPVDDTFVCAPDASGENGFDGDPCEFINACNPGLMCLTEDTFGPGCPAGVLACCSPFCDLMNPACTQPEQECLPWFEEGAAPPGFADLGICSVAS